MDNPHAFASAMAVLTIVATLLAVLVLVGRLRDRPLLDVNTSLAVAATIAVTCMAGSLAFSEVYHFTPCLFCWWQRILMYPTAIILVLAAIRRDLSVRTWVFALTVPGVAFSAWHVFVQRVPSMLGDSCAVGDSCATIFVEGLGFATIPTMALVGFLSIIVILAAAPSDKEFEQ